MGEPLGEPVLVGEAPAELVTEPDAVASADADGDGEPVPDNEDSPLPELVAVRL